MAPTAGSAVGRREFLNSWKDYLPESWRNEATLSNLTVSVLSYLIRMALYPANLPRTERTNILIPPQYVSLTLLKGKKRRKTSLQSLGLQPKRRGIGTNCLKTKSGLDLRNERFSRSCISLPRQLVLFWII